MARRAVMSGGSVPGESRSGVVPASSLLEPSVFRPNIMVNCTKSPLLGSCRKIGVQRADAVPAGLTAHQGGKACLLAEHGERLAGGVNLLAHQYPDPAMEGAALRGGLYGQGLST